MTISVTGLTRRYRDQLALDDVTVDFEGPSITGLLGRNGAGKSTLMRIIANQEFASKGSVRGFRRQSGRERRDPAPHGVRARGPGVSGLQGSARLARGVVVLPELEQ
jgi:ABC-type multidrug transport system ATPase subunit